MTIYEKLMKVQQELKAPKNQYNAFGKYKYRNCEDILEALKPALSEVKAVVLLNDDVININDRFYVKATAMFIDAETGEKEFVSALAREVEVKKGMDDSQITGTASSYARKYALNGLFCIDDTKDADSIDNASQEKSSNKGNTNTSSNNKGNTGANKTISEAQRKRIYAIASKKGYNSEEVKRHTLKKMGKELSELNKAEYDVMVAGYEKLQDK